MMTDRAIQRIMDGTTWAEFCDALKRAGDTICARARPRIPSIGPKASAT